jgi:hypothetical protein
MSRSDWGPVPIVDVSRLEPPPRPPPRFNRPPALPGGDVVVFAQSTQVPLLPK